MEKATILSISHLLTFLLLFSLSSFILAQEVEDELEFEYNRRSSRGPQHWGELKREWAICQNGQMQSPIDLLHPRVEVIPKSEEISKCYKPGNATLKNRGHDIEVKWDSGNSKIHINGTEYILRQSHWHTPSEHSINGQRFAMELHMVHQSRDSKIAVIGLLYTIGRPNQFLQKLTKKIKEIGDSSKEVKVGIINPAEIEVKGSKYYRYIGSLTTPPCTEGVLWTVNKKIATVSTEQVALLREAVHDDAEENSRPLQPRNKRKVKLYNLKTHRSAREIMH